MYNINYTQAFADAPSVGGGTTVSKPSAPSGGATVTNSQAQAGAQQDSIMAASAWLEAGAKTGRHTFDKSQDGLSVVPANVRSALVLLFAAPDTDVPVDIVSSKDGTTVAIFGGSGAQKLNIDSRIKAGDSFLIAEKIPGKEKLEFVITSDGQEAVKRASAGGGYGLVARGATAKVPAVAKSDSSDKAASKSADKPKAAGIFGNKAALREIAVAGSWVGFGAGAYHGYKRTDSVGWAIGWALLGGAAWPLAIPLMLAQGFGKGKAAVPNKRRARGEKLAAELTRQVKRARGAKTPYRAFVRAGRIVFTGSSTGEHSLDVKSSSDARIRAHWKGYTA